MAYRQPQPGSKDDEHQQLSELIESLQADHVSALRPLRANKPWGRF